MDQPGRPLIAQWPASTPINAVNGRLSGDPGVLIAAPFDLSSGNTLRPAYGWWLSAVTRAGICELAGQGSVLEKRSTSRTPANNAGSASATIAVAPMIPLPPLS